MIPIAKNIAVVDEHGNEYEATYPRRAKGLVKNGRARFISDNKICLACPPKINLEDHQMTDTLSKSEVVENTSTTGFKTAKASNITYILKQTEAIMKQTEYLHEVIDKLSQMSDGDSGSPGSVGNILGAAKASALGDIVRSRETTNQQLLRFYEKVYDDLKAEV